MAINNNKLFPADIPELIHHLKDVLKSIPQKNESMRRECEQLIEQLKNNAPHFPTDKKTARNETKQFLEGNDNTTGVYQHLGVSPTEPKPSKKRSRK